ncbi:MAG: ABC transporter permease subunit [Planctomycetota bacterium]
MQPKPSFTGRSRRRTTHAWVRGSDTIARVVITLGGIGTIVAVLAVGVFLLAVAAPLFTSATAALDRIAPLPDVSASFVGTDESGSVAWLLDGEGDGHGRIAVVGLADGATLLERTPAETGLAGATAVRVPAGGMLAAVGFADGTFKIGRIGLDAAYQPAEELGRESLPARVGDALRVDSAVVIRLPGDRFSRVSLVAELGDPPAQPLAAPVVDVDVVQLAGGPLVAAVDEAGRVRVETITSKRNMMTGKMTTTPRGTSIEPTDGFATRFIRVSTLGDQLFLIAADGAARRYLIRNLDAPVEMERFSVAPAGTSVTAVERLFGGVALAVGDATGHVRVFFSTRGDAAADVAASGAEDGLRMAEARDIEPPSGPPAAVVAIAASPRSRLFAVSDATGAVRLLQSTTGRRVVEVPAPKAAADTAPALIADHLCIASGENRLVAAGRGSLTAWSIDPGYHEVSPASLLMPVWYENYAAASHAWETTGHEAFESKFGLVPLIFGTIKATLYSMLFATPVAILAAIYASQFMHPRWKSRIKPTIEMMASLPSVVLGFMAGLVFSPVIERGLMPLITGFFVMPVAILLAAHLWQLIPSGWRTRHPGWRLVAIAGGAVPAGIWLSRATAPVVERLLFGGDVAGWLDGRGGSGFGGWVVASLPLAALAALAVVGRVVNPWLRRATAGWSQRRSALAALASFLIGVAATLAMAVAVAVLLDSLRLDTRGGIFGTYVQRNALVVAVGMSFAIIPLIFTLADDALSSVPDHLRSASLGAGATPWQTAVRVIVPAAASGLFSAVMIGLGRAVGETMIVLMAAGNTPLVSWNLFNGFQTLSAAIATELPEAARGTAHYRVLFLAALTLFAITFVVNSVAEVVRQRFRRRAYEL